MKRSKQHFQKKKTKPSEVDSSSYARHFCSSAPRAVLNECTLIRNWAWLPFYKHTLFIKRILPCSLPLLAHALNNQSLRYSISVSEDRHNRQKIHTVPAKKQLTFTFRSDPFHNSIRSRTPGITYMQRNGKSSGRGSLLCYTIHTCVHVAQRRKQASEC